MNHPNPFHAASAPVPGVRWQFLAGQMTTQRSRRGKARSPVWALYRGIAVMAFAGPPNPACADGRAALNTPGPRRTRRSAACRIPFTRTGLRNRLTHQVLPHSHRCPVREPDRERHDHPMPVQRHHERIWVSTHRGHRTLDLAWSCSFPVRELIPIAGLIALYNQGRHHSGRRPPGATQDPSSPSRPMPLPAPVIRLVSGLSRPKQTPGRLFPEARRQARHPSRQGSPPGQRGYGGRHHPCPRFPSQHWPAGPNRSPGSP